MTPPSPTPLSRPAATQRSPNRKDRTRSLARKNVVAGTKESIVGLALTGRDDEEIIEILNLSPTSIRKLRATDPDFRARHDEAIASAVASARGNLAGTLPKTVQVINDTETGKNKSPLRFDAAYKKARGLGVFSEETKTEVKGFIGVFNADDLAREFREAKKRLSEGGG